MRILIVGFGSIARRHLANLLKLRPDAEIAVLRRPGGEQVPGAATVHHVEDAIAFAPDAALITGPATTHIPVALQLAREGVHLFIEKPLSVALEGIDDLVATCRDKRLVAAVGYMFRHDEALCRSQQLVVDGKIGNLLAIHACCGQYLPDWRPTSDYRDCVTAKSSLGGGALLELSHEIDYVRWLAGEVDSVSAQTAKVSDLEIDVEDTANLTLKMKSGIQSTIALDLVRRPPRRTCEIVGSEGTIVWDYFGQSLRMYSAAKAEWTDLCPGPWDRNRMYVDELKDFLSCVEQGTEPRITVQNGKRVLEIVLAAKQSAAAGKVVAL